MSITGEGTQPSTFFFMTCLWEEQDFVFCLVTQAGLTVTM